MISEKSVGAILFVKEKEPRYLLLHYEAGHWDFPKGHVEAGEQEPDTIAREVEEETGVRGKIITKVKNPVSYFYTWQGS